MAIQKINLGTEPLGEGGDTYRSANTKINENFSDTTHAASKIVGTATGQVPLAQQVQKLSGAFLDVATVQGASYDLNDFQGGHYAYIGRATNMHPSAGANAFHVRTSYTRGSGGQSSYRLQEAFDRNTGERFFRASGDGGVWSAWAKDYTTANTTKEEGTGYLVASSPVLKVQHDSFEKIHEAEQLDIDIKHIKTGVYEITGTTGLREDDGWNLKPPKDVNGNVLCICEASESNGVITLKTYKKKFDFETVSIVADYEQPTDIPEGAVVMLRFNDLPQGQLDEPELEEDPLVDEEDTSEEPVEESK